MITAFTVKNFKAIGEEPVRIELKPITLLFGANSAGKSSILHALYYAYEVFNNRNLSPEKSTADLNSLDLGGFENFVHNNDLNHVILIRIDFEYECDIYDIPDSIFYAHYKDEFISNFFHRHFYEKSKLITNCYVEFGIAWDQASQKPHVKHYETGFNNERIATINFNTNEKKPVLQYLNIDHPIFCEAWINSGILVGNFIKSSLDESFYKTTEDRIEQAVEFVEMLGKGMKEIECEHSDHDEKFSARLTFRKKLFEKYGRIPPTSILASNEDNVNIYLKQKDAFPNNWEEGLNIDCSTWKNNFEDEWFLLHCLFGYILAHPGHYVTNLLRNYCHLGPLREILSRQFSSVNLSDKSKSLRWEKGLAAWDILYWIGQQQSDKLEKSSESDLKKVANKYHEEINDWLSSDQRLNTGYWIDIQHYREIDCSVFSILENSKSIDEIKKNINEMRRFPEKIKIRLKDQARPHLNLTPHEVGVGISQVLPVVVVAIAVTATPLVIIEQPELHIHPAIQVQLGDLFIEQSNDHKFFLIETHSEHLLLRLLRRINETFEGELPPDVKPCTANDVAIYYLDKGAKGMYVRRLEISEDGDSKGDWPDGFFEERRAELF